MIDTDDLPFVLQDIYQRLMVDADDVGMAYDEVLQYVEQFEMDEDMLFSFIKDKIEESKDKNITESYKSFIFKYRKS